MIRSQEEILEILARVGAVITNSHIVYTSGKHGSAYVNKDAIYPHTRETSDLCQTLANLIPLAPQAVVAPAVGGVILSQWVAYHFSSFWPGVWLDIPALYADKVGEEFVIKRGYEKIVSGKRVLVVEDVINTGGSVVKTIQAVRNVGGEVITVGALCNRGGVTADGLGVPYLFSLLNVTMDAWLEAECPLCVQGIPINTSVGHGVQFIARVGKSS